MDNAKVLRAAVKAGVYLVIILLLQLDFNSCESSSPFQVTGTVNGNVVLSPSNTQTVTEIMWKKGKNKVIEWDSYGVKSYPPFDGRVRVDHTSGDLHISNLTSSDEGEYEVEMLPSSTSKKINLTVFDPLPSPVLKCGLINESIEVSCEVPESYSRHREQLTYSWYCPSPQCGEGTTPVLHLEKNNDLPEKVHCSVANPESNGTSSVDLSTCVPRDNPRYRYALLGTPLVAGGVLFGLVWYFWKCGRKAG